MHLIFMDKPYPQTGCLHQVWPMYFEQNMNNKQVSITCPGCGITQRGTWNPKLPEHLKGIGSFSMNLEQPICCNGLRGKELRISYNNYKNMFLIIPK